MPRITYKPEGSTTERVWDVDFGKIMSPERILIEKAAGCGWDECKRLFFANATAVVGSVMFVMLKREIPELKFSEFQFCDDDFETDLTDAEARETLAAIDKAEQSGAEAYDDEARVLQVILRERFADAEPAEDGEGEDPKED